MRQVQHDHETVLMTHVVSLHGEISTLHDRVLKDMAQARSISRALRFQILQRDKFTCQYCGARAPTVPLQVDHIIPVCRGGSRRAENLRTACEDCNAGKGAAVVPGDVPRASSPLDRLLEAEEAMRLARIEWHHAGFDLHRLDLLLAVDVEPEGSDKRDAALERLFAYLDSFVSDDEDV